MDEPTESLNEGLIYEARLPFSWREVPAFPDEIDQVRQNTANEDLLRVFAIFEHSAVEHPEEKSELAQEIVRLDAKLSLALDLLGDVLARQMALPAPVALKLGARGLEWRDDRPPPVGTHLAITLYLYPKLPRPLLLNGLVTHSSALTVRAGFEGMSDAVRDWLEKMIFRHHRRAVALARAQRSGDA